MKYIVSVVLALIFVACGGYKPVPQYSFDIFDQPVLTKVKMDPEDPDSGVFLQDELSRMAINRLNLTITKDVDMAKGYILVNSYTINTTPLNKDDNGNVIRYSVNAAIEFAIKDKYGFWSKNIVTSEYVSVKPQSLVSTYEKEKAGRLAIQKALDEFVVAVMKRSREVGSNKSEMNKTKGINFDNSSAKIENKAPDYQMSSYDINEEKTIDTSETTYQSDNLEPVVVDGFRVEPTRDTDININIVPVDSNHPIQDATNYN